MLTLLKHLIQIILLVVANKILALDESRLWLPTNYERQYLSLVSAAKAAESLDRCVEVVRGTIDLNQSTKDLPIFRIQCRQESGRTYNEMVNGLTFETITTPIIDESKLTPEEQARKLEELESAKKMFLNRCLAQLGEQTKLFINMKLLSESHDPSEFSLEQARYDFQFDAENMDGIGLSYVATCFVGEDVDIRIRAR